MGVIILINFFTDLTVDLFLKEERLRNQLKIHLLITTVRICGKRFVALILCSDYFTV